MARTIRCFYSCNRCGIKRRFLNIAERDPGQDVVEWLERVANPALVADHENLSPGCRPSALAEFGIPTLSDTPVGEKPSS